MKKFTLAIITAATLVASCNNEKTSDASTTASTGKADSTNITVEPAKKAWVAVDSATEMKKWIEYGTPGEEHKGLARSAGKWTGKATMWMTRDAQPITSAMKMEVKMLYDGRYQESSYSGDMGGMPFSGVATTGYDNTKKKFISSNFDSMGTGLFFMEGNHDKSTDTYTYEGTYPNPVNGIDCQMKQSFKIVDANSEVMEMWGPDSKTGETYKTMEVVFTRVK